MNKILAIFTICAVAMCVTSATLNIIEVYNKAVFNIAVLKNRKPVIVYYSNARCQRQTCEWIGPQLERIAKKKSEKLYLAKINTDKIPSFIQEHRIEVFPTVVVYNEGQIVDIVEGGKWDQIVNLVNRAARL